MMNSFYLHTLGCKSNQYESEGIRESLIKHGFTETEDVKNAAWAIVNSCAVTVQAEAGSRQMVHRIKRENPNIRIVLTGCSVDLGSKWIHELSSIELIITNSKKHQIADLLANIPPRDAEDRFAFSIQSFEGHTRAFVKIQDGCDHFCSYCVIPYARGKPESRPLHAILSEAQKLTDSGYGELVLTGINIGNYKSGSLVLADVINGLIKLPNLLRLRLGSVEPLAVTDKLLAAIQSHEQVAKHLHVPMQHGDDGVLKSMNRKYTSSEYLAIIARIRTVLDNPGITTDVIVGFPSESSESFCRMIDVCEQAEFSRIHVFPYSPRPQAAAYLSRLACNPQELEARRKKMLELAEKA